jgi:hypothetical protein
MLKVGTMVRIVDHEDYDDIHRVGEVGKVVKLDENVVFIGFGNGKKVEEVDYPPELVEELTEEEAQQLKAGGKDGLPDKADPTPPQMDKDDMSKLNGESGSVAQADSPESHASGNDGQTAGVQGQEVKLDGESGSIPGESGGTGKASPDTSAGQTSGVKGQPVNLKNQKQIDGATSTSDQGRGKMEDQVSDAGRAQLIEGQRVFNPIRINLLDEADGEDEYVSIGESNAIRNEAHLYASIRGAVKKALESMDRPFDTVDIVFRRNPMSESKRRQAERTVMATLHLQAEGKARAAEVRKAAFEAAKLGIKTSRMVEYTDDRYSKQILAEEERRVQEEVELIWPPKNLDEHIGQRLIVETIFGDRWIGNLAKGPGRMYSIKMDTGNKKFSAKDVRAIYKNEQKA